MSIFLKAVQRINPSQPDEPKKWYPVQCTTKMVKRSSPSLRMRVQTPYELSGS
ncbi:DNA-binding protein [Parabacteroides merdae]|uniref:DNA-binding protein n=1 Tax=Parabacteroides merdae TaxID=46503 RepID=UPI0039B6D0CD